MTEYGLTSCLLYLDDYTESSKFHLLHLILKKKYLQIKLAEFLYLLPKAQSSKR